MCTKVLEEAYYTRYNRSQRRERSVLTGSGKTAEKRHRLLSLEEQPVEVCLEEG